MTDLLPLVKLTELALPAKSDPGRPPVLDFLPISKLRIDTSYQRPVIAKGKKTIAQIMAKFSWSRFSPVIVARVPGTEFYAIIDGQHRCIAALTLGYERVPCSIVQVQPGEHAAIFTAVNGTVTPLPIPSLFKAARAAGEEWAVAIDRVCAAAGVTPMTYKLSARQTKPFHTSTIGTLRDRLLQTPETTVVAALKALAKHPDASTPGFFSATRIKKAIAALPTRKALPAMTPAGLAEKVAELKGRGYSRQAAAITLKVPYAQVDEVWS